MVELEGPGRRWPTRAGNTLLPLFLQSSTIPTGLFGLVSICQIRSGFRIGSLFNPKGHN